MNFSYCCHFFCTCKTSMCAVVFLGNFSCTRNHCCVPSPGRNCFLSSAGLVDIYIESSYILKLLQRKKKRKCNFSSFLAPQKIQGLMHNLCFPKRLENWESVPSSNPISWFCMPMLNTSYFSNKLMVRMANMSKLFSSAFFLRRLLKQVRKTNLF